jgi:hypothetical protein
VSHPALVLNSLKKSWRELRREQAGRRFQARYHRMQEAHTSGNRLWKRSTAVALILFGVVLLIIPGPGTVLIAVGAALLAEESLVAARVLDRLEVRVRKAIARMRRKWQARQA